MSITSMKNFFHSYFRINIPVEKIKVVILKDTHLNFTRCLDDIEKVCVLVKRILLQCIGSADRCVEIVYYLHHIQHNANC